jgi:hypothetical protein
MLITATMSMLVQIFYSISIVLIEGNRDAHQWEQIWLLINVLTIFTAVTIALITNFKQIIKELL